MIEYAQLEQIINQHLESTDKFLVALKIKPGNRIMVFIDGDAGVSIADCVALSREIEASLDREQQDFELDVSSVGVGSPLVMPRQYRINQGRMIQILLHDQRKIKGKLLEATESGLLLAPEVLRKGKKSKNLSVDEDNPQQIVYAEVLEARIIPSF